MISRLSKKGQVVIPKEIRDKLNIKPGDAVIFRVEGDRVIIETIKGKLKDILKSGKPIEKAVEFQRKLREEWD